MPFDRLVRAVDEWAGHDGTHRVFAQTCSGLYRPRHLEWTAFLPPREFVERVRAAQLVVAHAGMGSILTALEYGKPILVMPRRGDLGETRNDHQVATSRQLSRLGLVHVAQDEAALGRLLNQVDELEATSRISSFASPALIAGLRAFIRGGMVPARCPSSPSNPGSGPPVRTGPEPS